MNKYEKALDWLTWRCMEPNDDYEGLVYDQVPDFEIEANIEPLRELIEKATSKKPAGSCVSEDYCDWVCPTCGKSHINSYPLQFCCYCGQKINWDDYEKYLVDSEDDEDGETDES